MNTQKSALHILGVPFIKSLYPLAALFMVSGAQGATIYSHTTGTGNFPGYAADLDAGTLVDEQIIANSFNLASADTVRSVVWRGGYINDILATGSTPLATDVFSINFYSDSSGTVGSLLQSFSIGNPFSRTDTGIDHTSTSMDIYEYVADLGSGISLSGGTDHWISIFNNSIADGPDVSWVWGVTAQIATASASFDEGNTWTAFSNQNLDYLIISNSNIVPIPASAWLFGSALGILGWMRHKKSS
jgi:hypothetical protein